MTDREIDVANMARLVYRELTDQRPQWEQRNPSMVADFEQLNNFILSFEEVANREGGKGQGDFVGARERAERAAEVATGPIVRALRALQTSANNPALANAASFIPSTLNPLHGEELLQALNTISAAAGGVAPLLANQGVTAEHLKALDDAIAVYTPLAALPTNQQHKGSAMRDTARQVVQDIQDLLTRLDAQINDLRDEVPGLAQRYDDARRTADADYPQLTGVGRKSGGDGSEGGIGQEAGAGVGGPEPQPFS
jgi:hypothetical protein